MGAFYGSVHIRGGERELIRATAEKIARLKGIHLYLSPMINGWISLFPENNGQDQSVGEELSKLIAGDVIHLLVHDDDVFAYWYFRGGDQLDCYWSRPGYFKESQHAAEEQMRGNPELFRPLIGEKVTKLSKLLERDDVSPAFASEQLEQVAKLLGISNAANAYEYLKEGEHAGVKGWRKFEEIPADAIAAEKQAIKAAQERIKALRKQLQSDGVLLSRVEHKQAFPFACPVREGILVTWRYFQAPISLEIYRTPRKQSAEIPLEKPSQFNGVVSNAAGNRVVINIGNGVRICDVEGDQWQQVADIPERDWTIAVAVSADGKQVAHSSRNEIVISESASALPIQKFPGRTTQVLAFHPSGEWLVAGGNRLGLIALNEQLWRDLFVGGKNKMAGVINTLFRSQLSNIDLESYDRQAKQSIEKMMAQFSKSSNRGKAAMSAEQLEEMRQSMEKTFQEQKDRLIDLKEGRTPPPEAQGIETVLAAGFSRDGRWLWCGTNAGLRVYEWSAVPREHEAVMPRPTWSFQLPTTEMTALPGNVTSIVEERNASAIAFAGGNGVIYRMELSTGQVSELIKLPGDTAIFGLTMSNDGKAIGVRSQTTPSHTQRSSERRSAWEIFAFDRLIGG